MFKVVKEPNGNFINPWYICFSLFFGFLSECWIESRQTRHIHTRTSRYRKQNSLTLTLFTKVFSFFFGAVVTIKTINYEMTTAFYTENKVTQKGRWDLFLLWDRVTQSYFKHQNIYIEECLQYTNSIPNLCKMPPTVKSEQERPKERKMTFCWMMLSVYWMAKSETRMNVDPIQMHIDRAQLE